MMGKKQIARVFLPDGQPMKWASGEEMQFPRSRAQRAFISARLAVHLDERDPEGCEIRFDSGGTFRMNDGEWVKQAPPPKGPAKPTPNLKG